MGLDDIHLSIPLCKSLFPNGLVYEKVNTENSEEKIHFKGKNLKSCLVLIDVRGNLKEEEIELLNKLLNACNLSGDDIALVNLSEQSLPVSKIFLVLQIQKAILFGISNSGINLAIPNEEDKVIQSGECLLVRTIPISGLMHNASRKKSLWNALKELFKL